MPKELIPIVDADIKSMMTGNHHYAFGSGSRCNEDGMECKDFRKVCTVKDDISRADSANGVAERIAIYGEYLRRNPNFPSLNNANEWHTNEVRGLYILKNSEWQIVESMHEIPPSNHPACLEWR
ncbi:MAG: hypothetical protein EPO31_08325 [Gammaproteobacteria bacterium]|nr:MAG: hypothetical protein EPO31_08325 [Gammaproteobacteria bacterium]